MIASAMEDLAQCLLEEGRPLPTPNPDAAADADLVDLVPLTVHVGALRVLARLIVWFFPTNVGLCSCTEDRPDRMPLPKLVPPAAE
jgi:hypothetical protein